MKNQLKTLVSLTAMIIFSMTINQATAMVDYSDPAKKIDTVNIQTSAVCKMCKERLEHDMSFEKGVKSVELDMDSKVLTIVYKKDKTTVEKLKKAVTEIGYDADEMVADQKAHDRLPACCQKGVDPH
jgi:copper chaperone CopZ